MVHRFPDSLKHLCCLLSLCLLTACSEAAEPVRPQKPPQSLELPLTGPQDTVIYNSAGRYSFLYAPAHRQARWVAYKLTRSDISAGAERSDNFRTDPLLAAFGWPSASNADYTNSGYDRGHLLPSADRTASAEENRATFLFSNIAPQLPRLNRGVWKNLEEELRRVCADFDTLYIVTGGVLPAPAAGMPAIGRGVTVPPLFFKAIVLRSGDSFQARAYVIPNGDESSLVPDFRHYEVTVDSVRRLTGIRLFPNVALEGDPASSGKPGAGKVFSGANKDTVSRAVSPADSTGGSGKVVADTVTASPGGAAAAPGQAPQPLPHKKSERRKLKR